jgi:branched-chain amino acid transport system substrate-binding protein
MVPDANNIADSINTKLRRRQLLKAGGAGAVATFAGCLGGDGGGSDSGEIVFGQLAPSPGDFPAGTAFKQFGELFVEQLNNNGGLLDRDVSLVTKDTEIDPSTARERYRELLLEEEADVTFGIFQTEAGVVIQDELSEFETLHLSGGASGSDIPSKISNQYDTYKYWFRTNWNGRQQGGAIARFAQSFFDQLGYDRIAVVREDVGGFDPIVNSAVDGLPDGLDIAFQESYSSDTTDFTPVLDRAESENIDFMLAFIGYGGVPLLLQYNERNPDFELGGGDTLSGTTAHYNNTEGAIEGIWTYVSGSGEGFEHTDVTVDVIEAHKEKFDQGPVHANGFPHYDSMETYVQAVEEVGSLDVEDVIDYIESDLEFTGTTGTVSYHDRDGKYPHDTVYNLEHSPPVFQWQDGEQVGLWPEANRTGEYQG